MNRYLWIQNGQQVEPDQFRDDFRLLVERHTGASPGPRTWRQVATAISREYIHPHLLDDQRTTSSDLAENHGRMVSHMHYARSANDIPTLSTDVICEMRAACHRWHEILGIGKNPPPVPLRLLSAAPQTLPTSTEFKAMIDGAVQEALARHVTSASTSPAGPLGHPRPSTHPRRSPPPSLPDPSHAGVSERTDETPNPSASLLAIPPAVKGQQGGDYLAEQQVEMEEEVGVSVDGDVEMEEVSMEPSSEPPRLLGK